MSSESEHACNRTVLFLPPTNDDFLFNVCNLFYTYVYMVSISQIANYVITATNEVGVLAGRLGL
jgi:hypothetical protein